jgi:2-(1,2-epoxy-1,2-dihydrophenyl)acetyl-CoA isomerase
MLVTPFLEVERRERIAILRMDRADSLNAIGTLEDCDNIVETLWELAQDRSVHAAILTGKGRAFCSGGNIKGIKERKGIGPLDQPDSTRANYRRGVQRTTRAFLDCEIPIVAAINGHAIAGGCVLALMCDWRICVDEGAKIGLNEVQLGIGLPAIVVEPLRAQVPPASLVPIALEGRLFAPREALEVGLVHELAAAGELAARAEAKARELAAPPGHAVAQVKRALRAPILEAIARTAADETERWLDSWFALEAQMRLRATVAALNRPA